MPATAFRDTTALQPIVAIKMRDAANALQAIQLVQMRDEANVLRIVFSPMSAAVVPSSVYNTSGGFSFPFTVTSIAVTATPTGGTAPYTYAWARISGDAAITATAPAAATTKFQATFAAENDYSAVFEVTVTDANGVKAKAQCPAHLTGVDYN